LGFVVVAFVAARDGARRGPRAVMKRLSKPGARYTVHVGSARSTGGTWNPTKPISINGSIHEFGTGTYWLGDDGLVHLDWTPNGRPTVHLSGPAPQLRPQRSMRVATLAVWLVVLAAGAIAFLLASGPTESRLSVALLVCALAFVLLWLVALSSSVGCTFRKVGRRG
jgi:hypothetical protein